ncbi:hypothetical protein NA8A_05613 [Nitratireductor indicus C115]|uniref:Uncharacterized protein n=1 Tax=Nitratireductor indicus C115 TaxID=1231190 RepID=K2NZW6_9HYPH|nr:hypothetical protein NA8A_05613 [Nitratireductor indicus C115]SFQ06629.1 hypothetical protein SAMN05216176_101183 [Nitratireductor indicus]
MMVDSTGLQHSVGIESASKVRFVVSTASIDRAKMGKFPERSGFFSNFPINFPALQQRPTCRIDRLVKFFAYIDKMFCQFLTLDLAAFELLFLFNALSLKFRLPFFFDKRRQCTDLFRVKCV